MFSFTLTTLALFAWFYCGIWTIGEVERLPCLPGRDSNKLLREEKLCVLFLAPIFALLVLKIKNQMKAELANKRSRLGKEVHQEEKNLATAIKDLEIARERLAAAKRKQAAVNLLRDLPKTWPTKN